MKRSVLTITFILSTLIVLSSSTRVSLETKSKISKEYTITQRTPQSSTIELTFAFKVSDASRDLLREKLLMVSDPSSPSYGEYLDVEAVDAILGVSDEKIDRVKSYLERFGVEGPFSVEMHGMVMVVPVDVALAEEILDTEFFTFCHKVQEKYCLHRAFGYSVDEEIADVIDFVGGVLHFPSLNRFGLKKTDLSVENMQIGWTPRSLRALFNTTSASPIKGSGNRQGVASFLGQYYDEPDLQEFFTLFYQTAIGTTPSKVIGKQGLLPGVEANLDVQYIMATSDLVDTWVYSNAGYHEGQEPFLKWLGILAATSNEDIPKTMSVSYGDDENSIELSYMKLCDTQFQALGARGVSVMFASGDSGASCTSKGDQFLPGWPATSPWVTAVGGTIGGAGSLQGDYISGGGFSDVFTPSDYQKSAIQSYLSASKKAGNLPPSSYFNATGRGFPDVGSPSENFWVVSYLIPSPVAGTSAACPSFTSVISLLNEVQMSKGKKSLGFLNPWLYANAEKMMQPVTTGCNMGCSSNNNVGFCAVKDQGIWSPVSGLGVPDFGRMLQYLP